MKKTLSVLLATILLLSCVMCVASADSSTFSVTLPTFAGRTRAIKDINTGKVLEGNATTADFTILYDSALFPDLTAINAGETFYFDVTLAEKYEPSAFTMKANDQVITRKDLTGLYAIYVDKNIVITIPKDDANENFALKRFTIVYKKSSLGISQSSGLASLFESTEGFSVYTYHLGDPQNAQTQNAVWGQDYYFKVILDDGYRQCITGMDVADADEDKEEIISINNLIGLNVSTTVCDTECMGKLYRDKNNKLVADMYDTDTDDIDDEDTNYTLVGKVYKIEGKYITQDMDISVSGVYADSSYKVLSILYRIVRLIMNILNHNEVL